MKIKQPDVEEIKRIIWVNNHTILKSNLTKEKPCHTLGWCPYGQLVELFWLRYESDKKFSCEVFGHDCPVFYHAEEFSDFGKRKVAQEMKGGKK